MAEEERQETLEKVPPVAPLSRVQALELDREELAEVAHPHHVEAFHDGTCDAICHSTMYRRLKVRFITQEDYPMSPVHVELRSDTLPEKLLKRLQGILEAKVRDEGLFGQPQIGFLYQFLDELVHENVLLYATPEVRQVRALAKDEPAFTVVVNDSAGTIKVKANCGKYSLKATLTVPQDYPADPLQVDFASCNFPWEISNVYLTQAREIARKCSIGMNVDRAVLTSTTAAGIKEVLSKIDAAKAAAGESADAKAPALTSSTLLNLKQDVKFLKQANDLREVNSAYNKQLHSFDYSTKVRRAARRELKKLSKVELDKEMAEVEKAARQREKEQMENWRRLQGLGDDGPQRSIRAVVAFLTTNFIFRLPTEKSALSGESVFPADPSELETLIQKRKKLRPVRVPTCGCYFVFKELETFMTTPPFGKPCPRTACLGAIVQHPDFENDPKKLEKAWAMKKAREREISEVSDMFGLDIGFLK